jgi:hypothetical protein
MKTKRCGARAIAIVKRLVIVRWNNMQSDKPYLQYLRMGFVGEGVNIALQHRVSRPEITVRSCRASYLLLPLTGDEMIGNLFSGTTFPLYVGSLDGR